MKSEYGLIVIVIIILISIFPIVLPSSFLRSLRKGKREIKDRDPIPIKYRIIIVILIIVVIMAFFVIPQYLRAKESEKVFNCQLNIARIGMALNLYAGDNQKHYPEKLEKLVPKYLNPIPDCPAAGADTYSQSYTYYVNPEKAGYSLTIFCRGHYHKNLPPDNPLLSR
ncbi:MAG: hypothetical protein K8T10_09475 [Candidatus Eremiobacteraeota bacterium]|nr:hypothetical protein [Candidatus Eremiobacteraeota bacterium]